jgi:hypothetical protein
MQRTVLAAVAAFALAQPTPAKAQFLLPPGHPRFHGGFGFGGPPVPLAGFASGFYGRTAWFAPGWGPVFSPFVPRVVVAPQVVVVPPPVFVVGGPVEDDPLNNNVVPALARRNDFIVIAPRKNAAPAVAVAEGRTIPHIDRIVRPKSDRPAFGFDPFARDGDMNKAKPDPEKPEADPVAEVARLVRLASEAFAAELYGRAVERLDAAIAVRPADPLPYFLKAQAQFAAGQYADAVASIREGMKRAPDWPASGFKPVEVYGPNPGRFDGHLGELRRAVRDTPTEPALEFLLGYELWFAGDRPTAVTLFRSAVKRGNEGAIIERFLREAEKPR